MATKSTKTTNPLETLSIEDLQDAIDAKREEDKLASVQTELDEARKTIASKAKEYSDLQSRHRKLENLLRDFFHTAKPQLSESRLVLGRRVMCREDEIPDLTEKFRQQDDAAEAEKKARDAARVDRLEQERIKREHTRSIMSGEATTTVRKMTDADFEAFGSASEIASTEACMPE